MFCLPWILSTCARRFGMNCPESSPPQESQMPSLEVIRRFAEDWKLKVDPFRGKGVIFLFFLGVVRLMMIEVSGVCMAWDSEGVKWFWFCSMILEIPPYISLLSWESLRSEVTTPHQLRQVFFNNSFWVFPKIGVPQNHPFNRVFHYKPSILGYPYFWNHPFCRFFFSHVKNP